MICENVNESKKTNSENKLEIFFKNEHTK